MTINYSSQGVTPHPIGDRSEFDYSRFRGAESWSELPQTFRFSGMTKTVPEGHTGSTSSSSLSTGFGQPDVSILSAVWFRGRGVFRGAIILFSVYMCVYGAIAVCRNLGIDGGYGWAMYPDGSCCQFR